MSKHAAVKDDASEDVDVRFFRNITAALAVMADIDVGWRLCSNRLQITDTNVITAIDAEITGAVR